MSKELQRAVECRRTFAIISHPDAGKTTMTEKLLLFGGAIQMAGAVKAKKASRHATSDWMAIEKQRGISVTTSVMRFNYGNREINLLDTPGHQDFSEDTYRTLTAVDSVLMIIDSAKGVESQTEKLMNVCRLRNTPIMTFINKLDREGREPLELLDDIEKSLGIDCCPMTWPIGMGKRFKGTYNLYRQELHLFSASHGEKISHGVVIKGLDDPLLDEMLGSQADELRSEIALLEGASHPFDVERYLSGKQTPVFFGSAVNNFGVRELLDAFTELAPAPRPRETTTREVLPTEEKFSAFAFKIQANMDPAHRDRIAFVRICSGKYTRGMKLRHVRLERDMQVNNATVFMAQDRQTAEEAYPGDIIGIHNHGNIKIGDTFTEGEVLKFTGIPNFAPEIFRRARLLDPMKSKSLHKGLQQLAEEGAAQLFRTIVGTEYIIGVVGALQFEVLAHRLAAEYGVKAQFEQINYATARWIECDDRKRLEEFESKEKGNLSRDLDDNLVYLASSEWNLKYVVEKWPDIRFEKIKEHA